MRSATRLDSAVFKLTPTRTRCDLVILANGKTEKIASGLFNPFLSHLKTAQDEINKGGYSVTLEPNPKSNATWFTKGTVERFVRFVSTPEVLERVTTIESEILQIENATAIQNNDNLGFSAVDKYQTKLADVNDGSKTTGDVESEKAVVIYKSSSQPQLPDSNGSSIQKENSKVKLLKVLETRKIVLQKEQGMAFARAVAAGFDMDNLADLISFAQSFGASRLMEACTKFMGLWKKKHETGQWVDVEVAEIASRSEFSYLNSSNIVIAEDMLRQKEEGRAMPLSGGYAVFKTNGNTDKEMPSEPKVPTPPEHFQGQFRHPTHPQWTMHSHPGPVFQPYTMQGMPHYHNYPGGMPYGPPPYPPSEDPMCHTTHQGRMRRHSMDNSNIEPETWERITTQDGTDENLSDIEKECAHGRKSLKKFSNSEKKSGVVVRNLNYITNKKHGALESESESTSYSESEETEGLHSDAHGRKKKSSKKASKKEESLSKYADNSSTYDKDEHVLGQEADSGNWQAFQDFLLKAEEKARAADNGMFSGEKASSTVKKQNKGELEHNFLHGRDYGDINEQRSVGFDPVNGQARLKKASSNDALLISNEGRILVGEEFKGIKDGSGGHWRMSNDDYRIYRRNKHYSNQNSSDPHTNEVHQQVGRTDKTDESFLLPHRSGFQDRTTINIDSELPSLRSTEDNSRPKVQISYEPDDLSLVPQRGSERVPIGYDPAMDYGVQLPVENARKPDDKIQGISTKTKGEVKKSEKKNSRVSQDSLNRKETMLKKVTSSRIYPSAEAQKRAEKLRAFKSDLQKLKKEQEEENLRRLEALKIERQKRIAARNSNVTQSTSTPQRTKAQVATKVSPGSYKGSKFSDAEPRSSPLGKLPTRTTSLGSSAHKPTKTSQLNGSSQRLTRSVSSLPYARKENDGLLKEAKTASFQIRRLSEPKGSYVQGASARNSVPSDQRTKKVHDESQKKITAIMKLDQSKLATLPELKTKSSKTPVEVKNKSHTRTGSKSSQASHNVVSRYDNRPSRRRNSEDNVVSEKTVLMLENNVTPAPIVRLSQGSVGTNEKSCKKASPSAGILTLPLPKVVCQFEDSTAPKLDERLNSVEVVADCSKDVHKFSNSMVAEQPYQSPHARVSTMEDSATTNVGYALGVMTHSESIETQVSSFVDPSSMNKSQGTSEKLHKEAKGFKKLLKFGKRSHNSVNGEGSNHDSDASSFDDHAITPVSSHEVHLLKHLISQEDTHTESTPTKATRPFSLLSPFR